MLGAAAAFGGGIWMHQTLESLPMPRFARAIDETASFKLTVHLLSASIPRLSESSRLFSRERPRIEVVLGKARKETELGDFCGGSTASGNEAQSAVFSGSFAKLLGEAVGMDSDSRLSPKTSTSNTQVGIGGAAEDTDADMASFPWRFGDTLTFTATIADLLGPGLQVWLRTNSDWHVGPLQLTFARPADIGVCSVDMRKRVLPACTLKRNPGGDFARGSPSSGGGGEIGELWETPAMSLSLTHVGNEGLEGAYVLGEAAAEVIAIFGVNTDPAALVKAADEATKPFLQRVACPVIQWVQEPVKWVNAVSEAAGCDLGHCYGQTPRRSIAAQALESDGSSMAHDTIDKMSLGSGLSREGWISHPGPDGRLFWHHLSLGPPPWEGSAHLGNKGHNSPTTASPRPNSAQRAMPSSPRHQDCFHLEDSPQHAPLESPPAPSSVREEKILPESSKRAGISESTISGMTVKESQGTRGNASILESPALAVETASKQPTAKQLAKTHANASLLVASPGAAATTTSGSWNTAQVLTAAGAAPSSTAVAEETTCKDASAEQFASQANAVLKGGSAGAVATTTLGKSKSTAKVAPYSYIIQMPAGNAAVSTGPPSGVATGTTTYSTTLATGPAGLSRATSVSQLKSASVLVVPAEEKKLNAAPSVSAQSTTIRTVVRPLLKNELVQPVKQADAA